MNHTRFWLPVAMLAALGGTIMSPVAEAQRRIITLESLEQQALATRQSLAEQQARIRRAAAEVERRLSAYRPTVTLGSDVSLAPGGSLEHVAAADLDPAHDILVQGIRAIGDRNAFAAQGRYGATLDISVPLYDFGRTARAVDAARAEQDAAGAGDRAARRDVLENVRAAYLTWLSTTEIAAITEEVVVDAQARCKRITELVGEGMKPAVDIPLVTSDETVARLEASRSREAVKDARLLVEATVGASLPEGVEPDPSLLRVEALERGAGQGAPGADPALEALERQGDAARATASMYDRLHAPVIGFDAQLGVRGQNPIVGGGSSGVFPIYRVGVSVNIPLWDGGGAKASADAARAQAQELAARSRELSNARRAAADQVESDAAAARERLGLARELLTMSEQRLRDAQERYEQAGGPIEAIADATAMRRRANTEIVLARTALARAYYGLTNR